ncbi:hypothetical protein KC19_9G035100 [Ceratodon purpureus]|uniref:AP2/ERF domain-containing protein n=1 Tax=Ceratodon purpureus TaxID=3225 RepID=A0A8T0GTT8_CERPU|nr:hypothetical protein KC19_9G035100 [Ceratodon purpureus]
MPCSQLLANWGEALDWQADQEDEVEAWQVIRNLQGIAARWMLECEDCYGLDSTFVGTSLTASAQFPTVSTLAQGQALSSFHRYSFRVFQVSFRRLPNLLASSAVKSTSRHRLPILVASGAFKSTSRQVFPPVLRKFSSRLAQLRPFSLVSGTNPSGVVLQIQLDITDFFSRIPQPTSRLGKRRRSPLDPILQESSEVLREDHVHKPKFKGVRHRHRSGRSSWIAEIRQGQNKVWIGEFGSEVGAARAVDAAHYYYGKTKLLNFADAPELLSTRSTPPGQLTQAEKLQFVKKEAKWLALMASSLPSTPNSPYARAPCTIAVTCSVIAESLCGHIAANIKFRSLSQIVGDPVADSNDEVDDVVSHTQLDLLHTNLIADSIANGTQAMAYDMEDAFDKSPMIEDSLLQMQTGTVDVDVDVGAMINEFQMLENFPLRSPSPAPTFEVGDLLNLQGEIEFRSEQGTEDIWGSIEL